MPVVPFRPNLYEAAAFPVNTAEGRFIASGTLCGNIDFATPDGTWCLSPDEAAALAIALKCARGDVLDNSDPLHDPRIIER